MLNLLSASFFVDTCLNIVLGYRSFDFGLGWKINKTLVSVSAETHLQTFGMVSAESKKNTFGQPQYNIYSNFSFGVTSKAVVDKEFETIAIHELDYFDYKLNFVKI